MKVPIYKKSRILEVWNGSGYGATVTTYSKVDFARSQTKEEQALKYKQKKNKLKSKWRLSLNFMAVQSMETIERRTLGACTEVEATATNDLCPSTVNEPVPEMAKHNWLTAKRFPLRIKWSSDNKSKCNAIHLKRRETVCVNMESLVCKLLKKILMERIIKCMEVKWGKWNRFPRIAHDRLNWYLCLARYLIF